MTTITDSMNPAETEAPSSPLNPLLPLASPVAQQTRHTFGAELHRATKSLLWASRKGLYPPAVMGGLYGAGALLHESGVHPLYVLAGSGAALAAGVSLRGARTWLTKATWRSRWAAGCLAAATAWSTAAVTAGAGMDTPMPTALIVGGSVLAAPWWWIHRLRTTEHRPAPATAPAAGPAAITASEPLRAIEAAPAPHEHQLAWNEHVGAPGHSLTGSALIDPEPIIDHNGDPNGMAWIIDGGSARHPYARMRGAMEEIKATLDRPHVDSLIYLDQDPDQYKTRGRLVVLERNPLIQNNFWRSPGLNPATGLVPISVYPDGSGYAYYVLYQPGWGTPNDLVVGVPGSGKSNVLLVIVAESLCAGSAVMLFDPHGGKAFPEVVPRVTKSFLDGGEIYAGMRGLQAAHAERLEILHEVGEQRMGPEFGHPILHAVIDEASKKSVLGNPIISELLSEVGREGRKLWIKLTVALQDPSVEQGFYNNSALRKLLLAGNALLFRVASAEDSRMVRKGNIEVAPHELPAYFDQAMTLRTTGLGYMLTGTPSELPSRTQRMVSQAFAAHVPVGSPLDDRTGEAWQRGYEQGIRELERLAGQADTAAPAAGVASLRSVPDGKSDPDAKAALVQLFRERGQLTLPEIREARICSPSHTFNLLNQLTDEQVIEKPAGSRGVYVLRAS
ncbi:hypothetical protein [Streptosporangium lutulentum]|uniref:FtsK domain-containing protein n=1 Tax=Streptosporangium lutulentum TaxID=1461250 RepID=A0ABT9QVK2_9ACTN|nr:hypothetical protein [Streptosporangium lutulentum]MDP9850323.1 hypothetical protein [Streptosporangium lutulentum]